MSALIRLAGAALAVSLATPALAQDSLAPVRALYLSASYDEALAALDSVSPPESASIPAERYRVFCLMALGRRADAEQSIERIVTADPLYRIGEAAPRIRTAFEQVRARLLPGIVRARYAEGQAAFERKDMAAAAAAFQSVIDLIDTPEVVNRPGMDDIRMVTAGFLSLLRATREMTPADTVAPVDSPPESPPGAMPSAPAMAVTESSATLPEPVVVAPVPITQDLPPWTYGPLDRTAPPRGAIVVEIDEEGAVTSASIETPIHVLYDQDLVAAARAWRFAPARRDGQRVRATTRVEVQLRR